MKIRIDIFRLAVAALAGCRYRLRAFLLFRQRKSHAASGATVLIISLLSVSLQSWRAATINPVRGLSK